MTHLINASSITRDQLRDHVYTANIIKQFYTKSIYADQKCNIISNFPDKTLITMFYEPSTRTNCSFQAAAHKLGCKVISLTDKASSSEKGESLEDTIRTLGCYGDAIILRHPTKGSAERAAEISTVPIINGGDGNGEHPTQALLDIFTIYEEIMERMGRNIFSNDAQSAADSSHVPPLTITFVGDLKNSRTIHSLIRLLVICGSPFRFIYVSPPSIEMPSELLQYVAGFKDIKQEQRSSINDAIEETDVLYMTRIQRERFASEEEYNAVMLYSAAYKLTPELVQKSKEKMIIMHPLPRLDEIPREIDYDKKAVYFKQVQNGLYMRMAILNNIFSMNE
jgi:carbamoyl-phosphate synthase/aspartate carbamoyltransferase